MAAVMPKNPRPMLQDLVNDAVVVRLKWGETEYHGRLVSVDSYMNVQLADAEEVIEGQKKGTLGNILIRCNNVLWISGAQEGKDNGDVKMG